MDARLRVRRGSVLIITGTKTGSSSKGHCTLQLRQTAAPTLRADCTSSCPQRKLHAPAWRCCTRIHSWQSCTAKGDGSLP